ncbi:MAG: hypothetical protein ACI9CE_003921 [Flavobacterium sp.]
MQETATQSENTDEVFFVQNFEGHYGRRHAYSSP